MINRIRTLYHKGLNKGFGSNFCVGNQVWFETPEEGWRMHQPKHYEYNNEDEDNSPNILSDKKYMYIYIFNVLLHFFICL